MKKRKRKCLVTFSNQKKNKEQVKNETEALFDIYDGMMWKDFRDENTEPFFTKEFANTHIGLMLNMDWFQPFLNLQYSVGVIYAVICNLPRTLVEIRQFGNVAIQPKFGWNIIQFITILKIRQN